MFSALHEDRFQNVSKRDGHIARLQQLKFCTTLGGDGGGISSSPLQPPLVANPFPSQE